MRKIRILVISILLILGFSVSAFAAEFPDVSKNSWYYPYVSELSDLGIINGYGNDGTFKPDNNITCAEILKLILKSSGYEIEQISTPEQLAAFWGSDVIATAEKYGIVQPGSIDGKAPTTRTQAAQFITAAMGWQNASHIDSVFEDTEDNNAEILYQKGIITGVKGEAGYYYKPNNNIKRSEVSAIVHRLYKYDPLAIKPVTGVAEGLLVSNPTTERHFEKVLIYMGMNNLTELKITYTTAPSQYTYEEREGICKNVLAAQNALFEEYHEYFCYVNTLKVATSTENGKMILTISAVNDTFSEEEIKTMRAEFFKTATASLEEIIAEGLITSEMTDMQKAQVVFEWVCQNCQYDNSFNTESYFGYGAAVKGKAVCQGYTALYNTMCKQLGIWCEGLSGTAKTGNKTESHIWTVANIDGKDVHIDVTFGDTGKKAGEICSYDYFCKDSEVFKKTHTWQ